MAMATQKGEKLSRINELANQAAAQLGLIVLDLHSVKQGQNTSLTICIYRKEVPISFADCEEMSRALEQLLTLEQEKEAFPAISGPFSLEIISPGIERQLTTGTEFVLFSGSPVHILAREKINALGTEFVGLLAGGDEHSVIIKQAQPLVQKQDKKKKSLSPDRATKADRALSKEELANEQLVIDLKQIYRVNLWPGVLSS